MKIASLTEKLSRVRPTILVIIVLTSSLVCLLLLVGKFLIYPRFMAEMFRLRQNEDGSLPMVTGYWASFPADTHHRFYLWNITNPEEVIFEGAMPRLQEHGPYVYVGRENKENITWSSDGSEVSYRNRRVYRFNSSLSCSSCSENDKFFVPNVPYLGVSAISGYKDFPLLVAIIFDWVTILTGSSPIQLVEAGGFLFSSFSNPIVNLQSSQVVKASCPDDRNSQKIRQVLGKFNNGSIFGIKIPECPHAGLLTCFNNTLEPEFRVKTGLGNNDDLTKIVSYGGKSSPDLYMGDTDIQNCNDGGFNKQFLQTNNNLHVFISYLGRSMTMKFHEDRTHHSVPTFVYRIGKEEYDSNDEKNRGMRYENEERIDYFLPWSAQHETNESHVGQETRTPPGFFPERIIPGLLDKNPVPVFLSPAHMLWAPETVSSAYAGQHPNEVTHQPVEWAVNPTMGTAVQVHFRIQLNFVFARSRLTQSSGLPNSLAPTFWVHAEVVMNDEIMRMIKIGGLYLPSLLYWGPILFLLVATISISALVFDEMFRRYKADPRFCCFSA